MNIVYVKDEGCLAIVLKKYAAGVKARWFIDGVMYTGFLTDDEFLDMDDIFEEGE